MEGVRTQREEERWPGTIFFAPPATPPRSRSMAGHIAELGRLVHAWAAVRIVRLADRAERRGRDVDLELTDKKLRCRVQGANPGKRDKSR
jgi:hypothetical protein